MFSKASITFHVLFSAQSALKHVGYMCMAQLTGFLKPLDFMHVNSTALLKTAKNQRGSNPFH